MNMQTELMKTWKISYKQANLFKIGFENENLDYQKFYKIMNLEDDYEVIDLVVAEDVVKNYGLNNVLHLSGFEAFMNERLLELDTPLQRTFTEHPYLNHN